MRDINLIVIHCSATKEGIDYDVSQIRKWHLDRGFKDIGYHFLVHLDGTIERGRPWDQPGAHAKGYNNNSIGVCYCGGVEADGKTPKDTRTEIQKESLLHVLKTLMAMYPLATIYSHNEFANKACPSFDATKEYENL